MLNVILTDHEFPLFWPYCHLKSSKIENETTTTFTILSKPHLTNVIKQLLQFILMTSYVFFIYWLICLMFVWCRKINTISSIFTPFDPRTNHQNQFYICSQILSINVKCDSYRPWLTPILILLKIKQLKLSQFCLNSDWRKSWELLFMTGLFWFLSFHLLSLTEA